MDTSPLRVAKVGNAGGNRNLATMSVAEVRNAIGNGYAATEKVVNDGKCHG